jgi:serine/threonine protein kinase/WD40 repeat protein/tetratricopeptide (TPR) repeat protein
MNTDPNPAKALFLEAVEKHDPDQWPAFLDQACAGQPDLRRRVEGLLEAHREVASPVATVDEQPIRERPGMVIGPYKLMEQLGEGGMGLVFVAEQQHPVRRRVALKIIKPGMDTRQVVARFDAERQALALMDHPHIAKVLDGGETADGRPYFVMELVRGVPITRFCDDSRLTARERLELFVPVCVAVQHAHQKGIIHRDLKPSNVLVASHDGKPVVQVIDFGVAKAIGQQLTDKTLYTQMAQLVGTPLYMSPEQAGHSGLDIDTRTDIYALGVLLYELLTGTTPFAKERFHEAGYEEMRRIIREEEPPKPSTRISKLATSTPHAPRGETGTRSVPTTLQTIAAQRKSDPKGLSQLIRGELDWIVMKCLEKDRNRRYETANGLARDIQRYLHDEPVQACPPSAWYRLRKFARRNKVALVTAGLVVAALIGGTAVSCYFAVQANERAREAEAALDRATTAEGQIREDRDRILNAERQARLGEAAALVGQAHGIRYSRRAGQRLEALAALKKAAGIGRELGQPQKWFDRLRNEAIGALALPDVEVVQQWPGVPRGTMCVSFDGALERYVRCDQRGNVSVRRVVDDAEIVALPGSGTPADLWLSPDGHLLAVHDLGTMQLRVWRLTVSADGSAIRPTPVLIHEGADVARSGMGFSPDSQRLLYIHRGSVISIVTLADGQVTRWPAKGSGAEGGPLFRSDGSQVMFRTQLDGHSTVLVCDARTGAVVATLPHPAGITSCDWHPAGRPVATCCHDGWVRLWDTTSWQSALVPDVRLAGGGRCLFTPDGEHLLCNDWSSLLRVWDLRSRRQVFATPMTYDWRTMARDGRLPIYQGQEKPLELIRVVPGREFRTLASRAAAGSGGYGSPTIDCVALNPDGRLVAAITTEGTCALIELATGVELAVLPCKVVTSVAYDSSGALLVHGSMGLLRWPVELEKATGRCRVGPPQTLFGFASDGHHGSSPDGRVLAIPKPFSQEGALLLCRERAGAPVVLGPQQDVRLCSVSPDGRWVATASFGDVHTVKVWEAPSGRFLKDLPIRGSWSVGFSASGKWLATTYPDCRLWAVGTWEEGPFIGKEPAFVFSPDSQLMAVGGGEAGIIRLVECATGREYTRLYAPEQSCLVPCCFTPDGGQLLVRSDEGKTLYIWDLRLIRSQLAEMGLDWDPPPFLPAEETNTPALQVTIDLGDSAKAITHVNLGNTLVAQGKLDEALAEYEKAIKLDPKFALAQGQLGSTCAQLGRWDQALTAIGQAAELDRANHWHVFQAAALQLWAGDLANYRRTCREMLERFGNTDQPEVADRAAKTCLLVPDAVADLDRVFKLADRAVTGTENRGNYHWFIFCKALAEYRAGRHARAVEWLGRFAPNSGGGNPDVAAFAVLAMAKHKLAHPEQARAALRSAEGIFREKLPDPGKGRPFAGDWADWLRCQILLREAEKLLK